MNRRNNATRQVTLKKKVKRITQKLEKLLGVPLMPKHRAKPLDMLIATILSQNTNDRNSYRAYCNLKQKFPNWKMLLDARINSIVSTIKTGGMANQKGVRIQKLLREVNSRFGGLTLSRLRNKTDQEVFDILISFDGVGTKTAACVLLFSLGREVFPVDTHIHRICNRLGLTSECKTPDQTFAVMQSLIPQGKAYSFHTNLIRFGRKICKANRPLCGDCPLFDECEFAEKEKHASLERRLTTEKNYNFMILDNVNLK